MNKLIVFLAAALLVSSASVRGEDASTKSSGQTPRDQAKEKAKGAIQGDAQRPASSGVSGGFSPHYGHENEQLRRERQRQQQQPKPKPTDEERAERKRLVEEWEKTQRPAPE